MYIKNIKNINPKYYHHIFKCHLLLTLLMTPFYSFAEGGSCWIHKVKIETGTESIIGYVKGYRYWSMESDSINDSVYYTKALIEYSNSQTVDTDYQGHLYYYNEAIHLSLPSPYDHKTSKGFEINHLIGKAQSILTGEITRISLIETVECSMGPSVITPLALLDKSWTQTKPTQIFRVGDGYCSYSVYVFDTNRDLRSNIEKWNKLIETDDTEAMEGRDYGSSFREELRKCDMRNIIVLAHCYC